MWKAGEDGNWREENNGWAQEWAPIQSRKEDGFDSRCTSNLPQTLFSHYVPFFLSSKFLVRSAKSLALHVFKVGANAGR